MGWDIINHVEVPANLWKDGVILPSWEVFSALDYKAAVVRRDHHRPGRQRRDDAVLRRGRPDAVARTHRLQPRVARAGRRQLDLRRPRRLADDRCHRPQFGERRRRRQDASLSLAARDVAAGLRRRLAVGAELHPDGEPRGGARLHGVEADQPGRDPQAVERQQAGRDHLFDHVGPRGSASTC